MGEAYAGAGSGYLTRNIRNVGDYCAKTRGTGRLTTETRRHRARQKEGRSGERRELLGSVPLSDDLSLCLRASVVNSGGPSGFQTRVRVTPRCQTAIRLLAASPGCQASGRSDSRQILKIRS